MYVFLGSMDSTFENASEKLSVQWNNGLRILELLNLEKKGSGV